MMNEWPVVSVVIPSFNSAQYLPHAIKSILDQDYPHLEFFVIDGGSQDGTLEILQSYNGRFRWVSEPDQGHADAINKGWQMGSGEILAWLNADDCYAAPHAIRKAVEYFRNNPKVDVIYGDYKVLSAEGEVLSNVMKPRPWDLSYALKYCFYTITQPASFIRRSILEKVGFLDCELANNDDQELWLRIGLQGTIKYVPHFFAYRRFCKGLCQMESTPPAKVRTVEKILSRSDLPESFYSKQFQRRALSNAYLMGAISGFSGRHWGILGSYLVKAIQIDPINLLHILRKMTQALIGSLLPIKVKWLLRHRLSILQDRWYRLKFNHDIQVFEPTGRRFQALKMETLRESDVSS